jgi:hypothetical protein
MSTKPKKKAPPSDPAEAANARILEQIRAREDQKEAERTLASDIGLDVRPPKPDAANAAEFLADEWDRKNFGDRPRTFSRIIYGPDPLLHSCPHLKAQLEKYGLEDYANATAEAIRIKGENAVPDPVMQKGLRSAIAAFGVDAVAKAFVDRIMKIPARNVEVESESEDPLLLGRPMEEAVERYGNPGMAPKFLSDRCISHFGMRGYQIVRDERGDPVKVGTLIMAEIPEWMADRRRRFYAAESARHVSEIETGWIGAAERDIGERKGFSVLRPGENVSSSAAGDFSDDPELTRTYLGRERATGFRLDREV